MVDRFLFCVFVMVISDGFEWPSVSSVISFQHFSFTIVIVLDFLHLKISLLSGDAESLIEIILRVCVMVRL